MSEWIEGQEAIGIEVGDLGEGMERILVGRSGVTRIELIMKSGMYAAIPYLRVWKGDKLASEFCQHNIISVVFG